MASTVGQLLVSLGLDVAQFKEGLDSATKITNSITGQLDRVADKLANLGTAMTAAITAPLVGAAAAGLSLYGEFESSLNKVSALGEITGSNLDKLRNQALQLGKDTKFSAQEAADGMAILAAKGFDTTKIMEAMPGVLALAATEAMGIAQASEIATSAMGQFGLATTDLNHIADVLAKGSSATSASVSDLGESLKLVGPIAKLAGLSLEETTAMAAKLSDAGIKGTEAGTSLRGTLASLLNPSKEVAAQLAALGVNTKDASGNMRPFMTILDDIKASGANAGQVMNIFGRESASAASVLMQTGGPAIAEFTNQLVKSDGAAAAMAKTMNAGLKGAVEEMKGSIETAGIALGSVLAPYAERLAHIIQDLSGKLIEGVNWFSKLPEPVKNGALAIAAIAAAIGPVLLAISGITTAVSAMVGGWTAIVAASGAVSSALTGLGVLFAGVTLPATATVAAVAAVTAALGAMGYWVYSNWEPIKAVLIQAWDGISDYWMAAWGPTIDLLVSTWKNVSSIAQAVWTPIKSFLVSIWEPVAQAHVNAWNGIASALTSVWNGIKSVALTVWSGIVSVIEGFLTVARQVPGVAKLLDLDKAWESAKKTTEHFKNASTEIAKVAPVAKELAKANISLATSHQKVAEGAQLSEKELKKLASAKKAAAKEAAALEKETTKFVDSANKAISAIEKNHRGTLDLANAQTQLERATAQLAFNTSALSDKRHSMKAATDLLIQSYMNEFKATDALADAYKTLGVTSTASLEEKKQKAVEAYNAIANSGKASAADIQAAWNAMHTAGQESEGKSTSIFKSHIETKKTAWTDFASDVTRTMTRFSDDIVKTLFDNPGSIGEKFTDMLKGMGQALISSFIEPATKAIGDFISGTIKNLLGGEGFGGMINSLTEIGSKITGIFGGASDAAGAVGSAGSAAGSAGGAAGSAAGAAASGLAGIVTAAASVVTAITGVIGLFQGSEQSKTLDTIGKHTLQTANDLANLRRDEWDRENHLMAKLDDIWRSIMDKSDFIVQSVYRMTDLMGERLDLLIDIRSDMGDLRGLFGDSLKIQAAGYNLAVDYYSASLSALQGLSKSSNVEVNIYNPQMTNNQSVQALSRQVSEAVAADLRRQGVI